MRRLLIVVLLLMPASLMAAMAAPAADFSWLSLGVAPFEAKAPPGARVPDVATLLADRLGTLGLANVVGPQALNASNEADVSAELVRSWAAKAKLDAIVVGRTTRIGGQLSVDVRIRSGKTGDTIKTLVRRVTHPADLEASVGALANDVLAAASRLAEPGPLPAAPAKRSSSRGKTPFGFKDWDSDRPMSIESESLDAIRESGKRRMIFTGNVKVVQGNLTIRCDRLDAFYPADANQPDRLSCRGNVRLRQGDQRARCDEAVYDRAADRLTCKGNAVFEEDGNELRGAVIEIDLAAETMHVMGGARVLIRPREKSRKPGQGGDR